MIILCKSKCCSIATVIAIILALATIAAIVCLVIKKYNLLEGKFRASDDDFLIEGTNPESDIPYTADKDFV